MTRLALAVIAATLMSVFPQPTDAHPGRVDAKGCHKVWQDWKSQDGKRPYKAGMHHCHRVSDEVRLGQDMVFVEELTETLQKGRDRAKGKQ